MAWDEEKLKVCENTYGVTAERRNSVDMGAFLQEFRLEALEHLEHLNSGLLRLEREGLNLESADTGVLRQMFLSAHTIKGGASMLSLSTIKTLTHALEDVLAALRDGREPLSAFTVEMLFETLDALKVRVEGELQPLETLPELETLLERLKMWPREMPGVKPIRPVSQSPEAKRALLLEPSGTARWVLKAQLEKVGFEVVEVESLEAALDALEHSVFARVLCPFEPGGIGPEPLLERFPELQNLWITALESVPVPLNARLVLKSSWKDEWSLERV